jgi:hypothetical protein
MHPVKKARLRSPEGDVNTSTTSQLQSLNGGKNNDKYVFERLKKEIN